MVYRVVEMVCMGALSLHATRGSGGEMIAGACRTQRPYKPRRTSVRYSRWATARGPPCYRLCLEVLRNSAHAGVCRFAHAQPGRILSRTRSYGGLIGPVACIDIGRVVGPWLFIASRCRGDAHFRVVQIRTHGLSVDDTPSLLNL